MSVHEIKLPSPPPETNLKGSMSGLFNRAAHYRNQAELYSDTNESDIESAIRKRVGFHPWTTNILEPQLSTPDSEHAPTSLLKSLPPSRDCQISSRPILKATTSTESAFRPSEYEEKRSHADKMESLLSNIEVGDRSVSTDAYQTMISLIKNYAEPPEAEILQAKMTKLQLYIRRDLVVLDASSEPISSEERLGLGNLISSALKVLVTMVWSPVYSPCLSDEFCLWAVDRAITVLKEHNAAKAILLHYMHLIATQNFRPVIFTNSNGGRTVRILEALQNLTDYVSGKAVIAERLLVYEKLMTQAKQIMEKTADLWVKNLLTAMGHSFKEVRKSALSTGSRACNVFADSQIIANAARQALNEETGERTVSASITNKLEKLVAAKEDVNQIPQLWTIVLMLCNNSRVKLETWSQTQLHEWLKLIQRCFNSSDPTVHIQALMAWNRLYYIARPHEASDKIISMLAKPAMKKLDVAGPAQSGKGTRQALLSSYCMLLYYAFRPSLTHPQITRMWNEFVVKIMTSSFLSRNSANCDLSCRVLSALFHGGSASRVWNERRAQENAYLDPCELPAIDNKWTRSHALSILAVLKLVMNRSSFGPDGAVSEQAYAAQCWRNFNKSVRESSSKEVVPSTETRAAQQSIVEFLASEYSSSEASSPEEAKVILLANITVHEFTAPSLILALETSVQTHVTIVLQALISTICQSIDRNEGVELNQRALHRCLKLLKQSLELMLQESYVNIERDVRTICAIFRSINASEAFTVLEHIQKDVTALLDILGKNAQSEDEQFPDKSLYVSFANASIDLLASVDISKLKSLDDLLAVISTSRSPQIKQKALFLQRAVTWTSNKTDLGTAVAGVTSSIPGDNATSFSEVTKSSIKSKSKPKNTFLNRLKQNATVQRPRHDDSQVEFVSLNSSPPQSVQFDSQLLTARQKEVRTRQENEPALTFADIRSSPSRTSRKANSAQNGSVPQPEIPNTPPLPRQQHEDDTQTPTPTPKSRKILQNNLQPEIPSSPSSVSGGETRGFVGIPITSSPIKEVTVESDDALQLSTLEPDEVPETLDQELRSSSGPKKISRKSKEPSDYFGKTPDSGATATTRSMRDNSVLISKDFETAPASSSPVSYSDEDDARAASQLSQNLLQESRSVSGQAETSDVETSTKKKRKRDDDTRRHLKKRKLPEQEEEQDQKMEAPIIENDPDAELSDCIVVNTSFSRPLNWRSTKPVKNSKSKKKMGTDSPASSQRSQTSSTSTPASQKSSGSRRRRSRGTARLTRSQSSQVDEEETVTQISAFEDRHLEEASNDTQMLDRTEITLSTEIEETPSSEVIEVERIPKTMPPSTILQQSYPVRSPIADEITMQEMSARMTSTTPARAPYHDATTNNEVFDAAKSLQSILDVMNRQSGDQELDLATIHGLCFQIGLKAQQLATQS